MSSLAFGIMESNLAFTTLRWGMGGASCTANYLKEIGTVKWLWLTSPPRVVGRRHILGA